MVSAAEIIYSDYLNENFTTVTQDDFIDNKSKRDLTALPNEFKKEEMLVGKSGKDAGDFSNYKCTNSLLQDGWKLFRSEIYQIKLM